MNKKHDTYSMYLRMREKQRKSRLIRLLILFLAAVCAVVIGLLVSKNAESTKEKTNDIIQIFPDHPGRRESVPTKLPETTGRNTPPAHPAESTSGEETSALDPSLPSPEKDIPYDYSRPMPASEEVSDSFFADAVFIGDSRTDGLLLYTALPVGYSYAYTALMVDTVFTKEIVYQNGEYIPVMDAVRQNTDWNRVYIMLGTNELGWRSADYFTKKYAEILDELRGVKPDCEIYLQSVLPINSDDEGNNRKVAVYNELLKKLAEEKQVYYLDVYSEMADENGLLPEEAANDGIHLNRVYCGKWLSYLKTHTFAGYAADSEKGGNENE